MEILERLRLVHSSEQTVLVVDDDEVCLLMMHSLLRQIGDGICVKTFVNPIEGLEWAQRHVADLVVIDCVMPDMDGIAFLRAIKDLPDYALVPTLMVTVATERSIRYEALDAGVTDFLQKPIDVYECFARCRNLLTLRLKYRGMG